MCYVQCVCIGNRNKTALTDVRCMRSSVLFRILKMSTLHILLALLGLALGVKGCGRPAITPYSFPAQSPGRFIVGGIEAKEGSWPWQVNVQYRKRGPTGVYTELICGGSIINNRFIVTAAHCLHSDRNPAMYLILAGDHDRTYPEEAEQYSEVKRLIIHPNYQPGTENNDIALIELETPLDFTAEVSNVCLPSSGSDGLNGVECVATGWGDTQVTPWPRKLGGSWVRQSTVLHQVRVNIINRRTCEANYYPGQISEQMICAGFEQGGKDPCKADSGGPLVHRSSSGAYELIGITSWGHGCALARKPGVYVRVGSFVPWIQGNVY